MKLMLAGRGSNGAMLIPRLGQAMLGFLFLISGLLKVGKYGALVDVLTAKGVPAAAVAMAVVIALEVAGGAALILGWNAAHAATALAIFVVPATLLFHAFWSVDAPAFQNQLNHFLKNLGILGALIMVASSRPAAD